MCGPDDDVFNTTPDDNDSSSTDYSSDPIYGWDDTDPLSNISEDEYKRNDDD